MKPTIILSSSDYSDSYDENDNYTSNLKKDLNTTDSESDEDNSCEKVVIKTFDPNKNTKKQTIPANNLIRKPKISQKIFDLRLDDYSTSSEDSENNYSYDEEYISQESIIKTKITKQKISHQIEKHQENQKDQQEEEEEEEEEAEEEDEEIKITAKLIKQRLQKNFRNTNFMFHRFKKNNRITGNRKESSESSQKQVNDNKDERNNEQIINDNENTNTHANDTNESQNNENSKEKIADINETQENEKAKMQSNDNEELINSNAENKGNDNISISTESKCNEERINRDAENADKELNNDIKENQNVENNKEQNNDINGKQQASENVKEEEIHSINKDSQEITKNSDEIAKEASDDDDDSKDQTIKLHISDKEEEEEDDDANPPVIKISSFPTKPSITYSIVRTLESSLLSKYYSFSFYQEEYQKFYAKVKARNPEQNIPLFEGPTVNFKKNSSYTLTADKELKSFSLKNGDKNGNEMMNLKVYFDPLLILPKHIDVQIFTSPEISMTTKSPKMSTRGHWVLDFSGKFTIPSERNMIFVLAKDKEGSNLIMVRQISNDEIEIDSCTDIDEIIIFAIGLSIFIAKLS